MKQWPTTADRVEANGGTTLVVGVDITEEAELAELADQIEAEFGRLGLLVNNAGVRVEPGPVTEFDRER
nr:SDR family NAD(P)-dependent oxidoreductase [Halovivax sp. KZCA124]